MIAWKADSRALEMKRLENFLKNIFRRGRHLVLDGGAIELSELSADPDAPEDGKVLLYAKSAGAGKTGLYARFPTGAVQTISTEP